MQCICCIETAQAAQAYSAIANWLSVMFRTSDKVSDKPKSRTLSMREHVPRTVRTCSQLRNSRGGLNNRHLADMSCLTSFIVWCSMFLGNTCLPSGSGSCNLLDSMLHLTNYHKLQIATYKVHKLQLTWVLQAYYSLQLKSLQVAPNNLNN